MGLYDIPRDDLVWVNTIGYEHQIHSELEQVESGNVVKATVTDEPVADKETDGVDEDYDEYWCLLDFEIEQDQRLYFVAPVDGYAPGPIDELWENRNPDQTLVTAGRDKDIEHRETADDRYWYEVHIQQETITDENAGSARTGELINVYDELQHGELLTEPLFSGHTCEYITGGAEAVVVLNPDGTEYVVMYVFPSKNSKYREIWSAVYDHVKRGFDEQRQ